MGMRSYIMGAILGLPALALLAFGPRHAVEVPSNRVVVRYWEKWTGVEGEVMKGLVDRFNSTEGAVQGIWVDYHPVANIDQRMLIATAGGDPPDLAGMFDHIIPQLADREALAPLDDLCREYDIDLESFKPIWLQIGRYEGRLYALPSTPFTIALFYNRRLFREAGLDPDRPPETLAEFDVFAQRLTRRHPESGRIVQLGFTVSPAMLGWWHWVWPVFFDAQLWDGHRFTLDDERGLSSMRWIHEQRVAMGSAGVDPRSINPVEANKAVIAFEATAGAIEGAQNPFLSERLAMVFQGPWMTHWIATYAPTLDYAVAPFPSVSRERLHQFASMDNFVIPRGAAHVSEAMAFLKFMMRQENLEELCREHGKVSPFRRPLASFYEGHKNPYVRTFDEMAGSAYAFGYPPMPTWAQTWTITLNMMQTVLEGREPVEQAVRTAQERVDRVLAEYDRMRELRAIGHPGP